jgi:replicative DNA helicase
MKPVALPHSTDAEQGVLSSMLQSTEAVAAAVNRIGQTADDWFFIPSNGKLYGAIVENWQVGKTLELTLFTGQLRDERKLDGIGGVSRLTEIRTFSSSHVLIDHYLDALSDKRTLRQIIQTAAELIRRAQEGQDDVAGVIQDAERALIQLTQRDSSTRGRKIKEIVQDVIGNMDNPEKIYGISTGYPKLDEIVGGLAPGSKIVIAAKTSAGKSALAANIAHSLAVTRNVPTAIFTFEMNSNQFAQRLLQIRSGISIRSITRNEADAFDYARFTRAASEIGDSKLTIINERLDIAGIRARCLQLKPRVAIIDYLQIVPEKRQKGESTTERLDRMSAETKQIADNLGITVLELSQVTTDAHGVSTTRYSSGITNDADQLWHVVGDDDDNKAKIDKTIVVAKQREGPKGEVEFTYEKALTRFTEK